MDIGKSLTVAKYLIKNYVINPFLRGLRKRLALISGILAVIVILIVILVVLIPPPEKVSNASSPSLRGSIIALGLNKDILIDIIGSILTFMITISIVQERAAISVMEEAEYEVLLAQPLDLGTYFLGRFMRDTVQMLAFTVWYFSLVPMALDLSGGRLKAALLPASIFILTAYLSALATMISELKILWRERWVYIRLASILYVLLSVAHSFLIQRISPLLSAPFIFLARSIVYCATISESIYDVLLSLGEGSLILFLILVVELKLAERISPEYIKPTSVLIKEKRRGKRKTREIYSSDPRKSIFNYLFRWEVVNRRHMATLSFIVLATGILTYILKEFLVIKLGALAESLQFISIFLIPLLVSEAVSFLINSSMARDLAAFWIYRVYARELEPVAEGLMLKYIFYLSEAFLVISIYDAIVTSPLMLLMPLIVLPLTVIMAFLLLMSVTYLASKRRIVRQAPVGLYMLEDLATGLVMVMVISIYMISDVLIKILLPTIPSFELVIVCASSLILALILHKVLVTSLSDIIFSYDLLS